MHDDRLEALADYTTGALAAIIPDSSSYLNDPPTASDYAYRYRTPIIVALIFITLISAFPMREHYADPSTYESIIETIDEKKTNVLKMITSTTALSATLSAVPGDAGTPIAEQLMDFSANFAIVLAVLCLEKHLLGIFGLATFGVLIPVSCGLLAAAVLLCRSTVAPVFVKLAAKIALLGAVLIFTIPTSVMITDIIDTTYENSKLEEVVVEEPAPAPEKEEKKGFFDFLVDIPDKVVNGANAVTKAVLDKVNELIEGLAVMVVTSCVIPILVLVFFLWVANVLLGIDISTPKHMLQERASRMYGKTE